MKGEHGVGTTTSKENLAKTGMGDEIIDILQTNGFSQDYDSVPHVHLIPAGARINHDCRPKCVNLD